MFVPYRNPRVERGSLLVHVGSDPGFSEKVVLMTDPGDIMPMGVIINNPSKMRYEFATSLGNLPDPLEAQSFSNKVLLKGSPEIYRESVYSCLYEQQGQRENSEFSYQRMFGVKMEELASQRLKHLRLIKGWCGWGEEQLELEIAARYWRVLPYDGDLVFRTPFDKIFPQAAEKVGYQPAKPHHWWDSLRI